MQASRHGWVAGRRRIILVGICVHLAGAVTAYGGTILVANQGNQVGDTSAKVLGFDLSGTQTAAISGFTTPTGLAFDSSGNLYVADFATGQINKFSSSGASLGAFASGLNSPTEITFDSAGDLFVSNTFANGVEEFSPSGLDLGVFASLSSPRGIAIDSQGRIYVASQLTDVIYRFNADGSGQTVWATKADGISNPRGLAFDSAGNLYVSSSGFPGDTPSSIVKISPDGLTKSTFATDSSGYNDIVFDTLGNLYVTNFFGNVIQEYSSSGTNLGVFASAGLVHPGGLAFDPNDFTVTSVPEPASAVLLTFGLIAGIELRRRSFRA